MNASNEIQHRSSRGVFCYFLSQSGLSSTMLVECFSVMANLRHLLKSTWVGLCVAQMFQLWAVFSLCCFFTKMSVRSTDVDLNVKLRQIKLCYQADLAIAWRFSDNFFCLMSSVPKSDLVYTVPLTLPW